MYDFFEDFRMRSLKAISLVKSDPELERLTAKLTAKRDAAHAKIKMLQGEIGKIQEEQVNDERANKPELPAIAQRLDPDFDPKKHHVHIDPDAGVLYRHDARKAESAETEKEAHESKSN